MKIYHLFPQSPHKKALTISVLAVAATFVFLFFLLIYTLIRTNIETNKFLSSLNQEGETLIGWENTEYQNLWKDKFWVENQIALFKNDSMSLGIHMHDSVFQLQFKGLPLIKSKIIAYYPEKMMTKIQPQIYESLFNQPWTILAQKANKQKKPFRKMTVNEDGTSSTTEESDSQEQDIEWSFITDNHFRFVIFGHQVDSIETKPNYKWDMFKYNLGSKLKEEESDRKYYPTYFLWLNNNDALSIYRALPENAKVVVRN